MSKCKPPWHLVDSLWEDRMKMHLAIALLLIVLAGCQSVEPNTPHPASIIGYLQDAVYINDYFNFRMAVPADYRVAATIDKVTYPGLARISHTRAASAV
jgi:hypothetical protein